MIDMFLTSRPPRILGMKWTHRKLKYVGAKRTNYKMIVIAWGEGFRKLAGEVEVLF